MRISRRQAIAAGVACGLAPLAGFTPRASADDEHHALYGRFHLRCPNKDLDVVTGGTHQHQCRTCGEQCFVNGKVKLVCPDKHDNEVSLNDVDLLKTYKCREKVDGGKECGKECEGWTLSNDPE